MQAIAITPITEIVITAAQSTPRAAAVPDAGALRVLVITELFLPTKGGTAVWFDEVYRRLGGRQIHIVTADVPHAQAHDHGHPNTVHRVTLARHAWLRPESLAMYARLFFRALLLSVRHRFDVVHAGRVLPEGLVALAVARFSRIPFVVYAHGEEITTWRQPRKLRAMAYVYRHADRVIANSEFTRRELLKLGVAADRITLIYPGVDVARFRPGGVQADLRAGLGLSGSQKLVLSVGRLSRRKGFDQTIRAIARLRAEGIDVHYVIIGIGEDRDYLQRIARECSAEAAVHLLGHVAPEDLPRWYAAADVFAMPNRSINGDNEGFGMVFLEAAACGKPAIAGVDGGTGDAVLDGITGCRVNGASLDDVSAALRRLLTDADLAQRFGRNGRERALDQFSWERVAAATRQFCLPQNRALPAQGEASPPVEH
jgi:phosphatidylinositol alpha-1,6-mannosyltransferase